MEAVTIIGEANKLARFGISRRTGGQLCRIRALLGNRGLVGAVKLEQPSEQ